MNYIGRFAPSPTGDLHQGSVVTALASWLRAQQAGGEWLVRIEDIDPPREIAGATARILDDLSRLGLEPAQPCLRQSQHHARYRRALQTLIDAGHAFPCTCSRQEIARRGGHRGRCSSIPTAQRAPAWRLQAPDRSIAFDDLLQGPQVQPLHDAVGDFVLWRLDDLPAYQLAVVVDDAAQGITEVVRGADLLDSSGRQILLQQLLGLPTPAYLHVPLVVDSSGAKLSKQNLARPVRELPPLLVLDQAWQHLRQLPLPAGLHSPRNWLDEATRRFQLPRVREGVSRPG